MEPTKTRHGCVTAWLILMIVANAITSVMYLTMSGDLKKNLPANTPDWIFPVMVVFGIIHIGLAIALFMWKKWAFYAFIVTSVAILVINVIAGLGISSVTGLLGVVILYAVMQLGKPSTWSQLEGWPGGSADEKKMDGNLPEESPLACRAPTFDGEHLR